MWKMPQWLKEIIDQGKDDYDPDEIVTISMTRSELIALRILITETLYGENTPTGELLQNLQMIETIVEEKF